MNRGKLERAGRLGKEPVPENGEVGHPGNTAYWYRRKLRRDPAKEHFVDDKEAGKRLDRERRAPPKWLHSPLFDAEVPPKITSNPDPHSHEFGQIRRR